MGYIPKFYFKVSFGSSKSIFPQKAMDKWWSGCLERLVKQHSWNGTFSTKLFCILFSSQTRHYRLERIWWAGCKCNHHNASETYLTGTREEWGAGMTAKQEWDPNARQKQLWVWRTRVGRRAGFPRGHSAACCRLHVRDPAAPARVSLLSAGVAGPAKRRSI